MTEGTGRFIDFDGTAVGYEPGQSIGAALVSAGIISWRTTRKKGKPRGLFCGIGVCYDCLVSVDGQQNQRACVVPASPGARVETGTGGAEIPGTLEQENNADHREEHHE